MVSTWKSHEVIKSLSLMSVWFDDSYLILDNFPVHLNFFNIKLMLGVGFIYRNLEA